MWHPRFDQPYRLGNKLISGRFAIPSGIRCTHASTIRKCFREVPSIGIITTKSICYPPRKGYREPIYARYSPGCYINAVGLANPGAESFLAECEGLEVPEDKFLLVSIFGSDVDTFVAAARVLKPIADGFELNMSCPHAKGYGAEIAQDTELLQRITAAVAECAGVPVFVKLSAIIPDLAETARAAMAAGAIGITMTNTIGPAMVAFGEDPILANKFGGLSGDGIRPLGLRGVEQVRKAIGEGAPIIGMGGVASAEHVRQYAQAGADFFGIGSALTGLDSDQMREYLAALDRDVRGAGAGSRTSCESDLGMDYFRTRVVLRIDYDSELFKLTLEALPGEYRDGDLSGKFFFLWLPGGGEKPFAIFSASEKSVVVRVVGDFTRRLQALEPGAEIMLRGPYGRPAPTFDGGMQVFVGGGTGIASLLEIAHALKPGAAKQIFLLGARTARHLCDLDRFRSLGTVLTATDDGSAGVHGYVSDLIGGVVDPLSPAEREGLAFINCGPGPMIARCFEIQSRSVSEERIVGSIEYMTSCGVGICGKCASPSGALTCIDGPFMKAAEFKPVGCRCRT